MNESKKTGGEKVKEGHLESEREEQEINKAEKNI